MRQILYDDRDRTLIRSMKSQPFSRIFHDGVCQHVVEFPKHHIVATSLSLPANTQNSSDEAIVIEFKEHVGEYTPSESQKLLFANQRIDRIWIARTVLFFTDFTPFQSEEEAIADIPDTGTPTNGKLRQILSRCTGGYDEVVCHPALAIEHSDFSDENANLVDTGILIQIGDQFLSCFSRFNAFVAGTLLLTEEELQSNEDIQQYEFMEI